MKKKLNWRWIAQCAVVLVCAYSLKLFYSKASANDLRWILAPTTAYVQLVSGESFEFESHAGYINEDHSFLIAASCAGVNFMITVFVMLAGRQLLSGWRKSISWRFIPAAAVIAYLVTVVANITRIAIALRMQRTSVQAGWLDHDQMHRFEGIAVYFGFLLLLFLVCEKRDGESGIRAGWQMLFPLLVYYAIMLGIPLANGSYRQGPGFWEHSLFVLLIPLVFILPVAAFRYCRQAGFGHGWMRGSAGKAELH